MGSAYAPTRFSALLIPGPYWDPANLWAAHSTYTEQSPLPPIPEPTTETDLALTCSGTVWDPVDLRVRGYRAGFPGPDGAAFLWQPQEDGSDEWRGWDAPNVIVAWEPVVWTDGGGAGIAYHYPHAVTMPGGEIVVVAGQYDTGGGGTSRVVCYVRAPDTGTWAARVTVYSTTDALTQDFHPCLILLPSGRLLCFFWREDVDRGVVNISAYFSDDTGATWAVWQDYTLEDEIDVSGTVSTRRLRGVYLDGQIALFAGTYDSQVAGYEHEFVQYASSDLGASLVLVEDRPDTAIRAWQDCVVADGRILLGYESETTRAAVRILDHAWRSWLTQAQTYAMEGLDVYDATSDALNDGGGNLSLCVDEDGSAYIYLGVTSQGGYVNWSGDGGETWSYISVGPLWATSGPWCDTGDASSFLRRFAATAQGGRIAVVHQWAADPGDEDNSIGCAYLGGYSTVTLPGLERFKRIPRRICWTNNWLPIERPDSLTPWTTTTTGGTAVLGSGALALTTVSDAYYYSAEPTGTIDEGIIALFRLKVVSGGALTNENIAVRIRTADGADDYDFAIRFTTTGFRVYDSNAAAAVGSDVTVAMTSGVEVLVTSAGGEMACWYRLTDCGQDRAWTEGPAGSLTSDTVTPASTNLVRWGHIGSGQSETAWRMFHHVSDEYTGLGLVDFVNPDDLLPRCYSLSPAELYGGVKLRAVDGPAGTGDAWDLDTRAHYPVEAIFPTRQPSPRVGWRSEDDDTECTIAVLVDPTITASASCEETDVVGLYLAGCNWRTGKLQGRTAGGAWTDLATIDLATGMSSLDYIRRGNRIEPNAASTSGILLALDEARDWTVALDGTTLRRVTQNGPGKWTNAATSQPAVLVLDGILGTEPASGTASLWASSGCIVVYLAGTRWVAYRILVDDQTTVDGDLRIGVAVLGPVVPLPERYSWGRVVETAANAEVTTAVDGSTRSRVLGPPARLLEIAWTDGVDLTRASGGTADPDYVVASSTAGSRAVALRATTPALLEGLLRRLDGPHRPIVYLPSLAVSSGSTDVQHLLRRDQTLYCRMDGPVRIEVVQGEERVSELVRVATLTAREVV